MVSAIVCRNVGQAKVYKLGHCIFFIEGRSPYRQHPTLNKDLCAKSKFNYNHLRIGQAKLIITQILYLPSQLLQPQYGLIDRIYYRQKICKNELLEEWI